MKERIEQIRDNVNGRLETVREAWTGETQAAMKRRGRIKRTGGVAFSIVRGAFLFSLCLILLYPLLIMLSIALRAPTELYDPTVVWIPRTFTVDAFVKAFTLLRFDRILPWTAYYTLAGTLLQLITCMLAGYGMARFRFPGKNLLFGLLLLTILVPPQVVSIPSMVYFTEFDFFFVGRLVGLFTGSTPTVSLSGTALSYFLPAALGAGIKSGLFIFIFIQFFRNLPGELQDAAAIDGCGRFKTFWRIMIPLSGSAILTVTLFSLVWYWNDSYFSVIHSIPNTIAAVLDKVRESLLHAQEVRDELAVVPQMQAAALISIAPMLAVYVVLQKYFTESIERTGIVG